MKQQMVGQYKPKGLPRGRPFPKGKTGNPHGRPKELEDVRAAAREHTSEAIERLAFWMRSENPRVSVAAASALLDRAWGRAAQAISGDVEAPLIINIVGDDAKL
jgi:hypothetical protein